MENTQNSTRHTIYDDRFKATNFTYIRVWTGRNHDDSTDASLFEVINGSGRTSCYEYVVGTKEKPFYPGNSEWGKRGWTWSVKTGQEFLKKSGIK